MEHKVKHVILVKIIRGKREDKRKREEYAQKDSDSGLHYRGFMIKKNDSGCNNNTITMIASF